MFELKKKIIRISWNELSMPKSMIDNTSNGQGQKRNQQFKFQIQNKDLTHEMETENTFNSISQL